MLQIGVLKVLRFSDHRIVPRKQITDPKTKQLKSVEALEFRVLMEDGASVDRWFSIISQKLAGDLGPYLADKRYLRYEFGFMKDSAEAAPRLAWARPI